MFNSIKDNLHLKSARMCAVIWEVSLPKARTRTTGSCSPSARAPDSRQPLSRGPAEEPVAYSFKTLPPGDTPVSKTGAAVGARLPEMRDLSLRQTPSLTDCDPGPRGSTTSLGLGTCETEMNTKGAKARGALGTRHQPAFSVSCYYRRVQCHTALIYCWILGTWHKPSNKRFI